MAALSVQNSKGGINVLHPSRAPISRNAFLNPLLAETPPAMQRSATPVSFAAFLYLLSRIETMRACTEAQISLRLAATKPGSLAVWSCRKYRIAVFNPLKLKLSPGICG